MQVKLKISGMEEPKVVEASTAQDVLNKIDVPTDVTIKLLRGTEGDVITVLTPESALQEGETITVQAVLRGA